MPVTEPSAVNLDNEALGTSPMLPIIKKSKKKKKQRQQLDDADDTPYAKSVTPSPPTYIDDWTTKQSEVQEPDDLLLAQSVVEDLPNEDLQEREGLDTPEVFPVSKSADRKIAQAESVATQARTVSTTNISQQAVHFPADRVTNISGTPRQHGDAQEQHALHYCNHISPSPAHLTGFQATISPNQSTRLESALTTGLSNPSASRVHQAQPATDTFHSRTRSASEIPEDDYDRLYARLPARTRLSEAFSPPMRPSDHYLPASPPRRLDIGRRQSSSRHQPPRKSSLFDAPPPHLPQARFYPAPSQPPRAVRFDTFVDAGDHAAAVRARDVLLVGMDAALDVYRVLPDKMEIIARLEGLQGWVLDAKILPVSGTDDPLRAQRPLVALVLSDAVEVYSLRTQEHIKTLYRSLPGIDPALKLDTNGSFLTISSGTSGEIFVFRNFECIGKFWTTLSDTRPLLAIGRRWLVIVCQDASMVSIGGDMPTASTAYGISSHAPLQPAITTEAHFDQEGLVSRMTRQAAREVRKGVELGWAGWSEFVQPTARHVDSDFPPTHAAEVVRRVEPAIVSIVDLERMTHIATFALEDGCNFLSLSTDAMRLVTTNRTGEATDVWDLTNLQDIRCIQRIARASPSTVVSAAWSLDDDYLALQTARTVHLHAISEKKPVKAPGSPPTWRFRAGSLADAATAARSAGGRMLAKGLVNGYGLAKAGLQDAWHADDNKIRLDGVSHRWLRHGLGVATSDKVYLHSVTREEKIKVEKGVKHFALPGNGVADCLSEPHGFWTLRGIMKPVVAVPDDEYDTNPSFCPFHVDKRVVLLAYEPRDLDCFGESIGQVVKVNKEVDSVIRLGG